MDALDYGRVVKATLKIGRGYGEWNTDEECTTHAVHDDQTACGIRVGSFDRGWLNGSWMRPLDVTCKRCLRVIAKETAR